jgi:hypothetical protein
MKRYLLAALFCAPLLISCGPLGSLQAAPPSAAQLPQDGKWVIHLDLQAIVQTELADAARDQRPRVTHLMQRWFQAKFGIDPREDLDSLTLFGDSYDEHQGTMILHADYEIDKVRTALDQDPAVTKADWEGLTLYTIEADHRTWMRPAHDQDNGERRVLLRRRENAQSDRSEPQQGSALTLILVDGKSIVIASSPELAQEAVGLARGDSPILAKDSPLLSEAEEGMLLYGAAIDLQQIEHRNGFFPVLAQHERIYWMIGGGEGQLTDKLILHAHTEEVAELMERSLAGSVAFGKVWAADSENLRKLVDQREISREGKRVELSGHGEIETLRAAIGELRGRFQQRLQIGNEQGARDRAN